VSGEARDHLALVIPFSHFCPNYVRFGATTRSEQRSAALWPQRNHAVILRSEAVLSETKEESLYLF
jgi:hypothetical protein